jgi:cholest-4-en-3-one 26-monooxygenase
MNLADVDILNPDVYLAGAPHECFALLRREAPVFWHKEPGGRGFWAVTRHADVARVSRDSAIFRSGDGLFIEDFAPGDLRNSPDIMILMDPPKHGRFRTLVSKGFMPRIIQRMETHVRSLMTRLIDAVVARDHCDFARELAGNLPLQVILEMVGIPPNDQPQMLDWTRRFFGTQDPEYRSEGEDINELMMSIFSYAAKLAEERRHTPRDDMMSLLVTAEVNGERLTYEEIGGFFNLLLNAGFDTTSNLITNGMLSLIQNPEERRRLVEDPSLIPCAVEEMLRFTPPVYYFRRTATQDTELRGERIKKGDKVVLWYVSANRDEAVFPNPDSFEVGRAPNEHLSFGVGEHFCLGAALARLEARVAFEELLRRLPDMELAGPVVRLRSNWVSGIKAMPVRFTKA